MDHLIDKFDVYIEDSFENFAEEWKSGNYKKFGDCPHYGELKTLLDSVNTLRSYMSWDRLTISEMLEDRDF